ncbi:MAG: A/G-specific adenine glycosylase [Deltaproteobacteria bacterium]|nr:A/G-specific adenine glycosylase [Deltaproteobacteria bacterium]MCB9788638.1 A/G-specific adenine glycosylase [Deltaproteobacteria bacterium]
MDASPPPSVLPTGVDPAELRLRLSAWYHTRARRLPWRDQPTPYRVWVSEIMLQQTQVATVLPYFERFVAALPDIESLARADEPTVLGLWAGLGYYRRARFLHRAAREVVARHGGRLPASATDLRALPGVGAYTAAAIASVAFGLPEAVVDGNVIRVLSRLVALPQLTDTAPGQRALQAVADALLDRSDPSSHNQAMMELGALVCSPRGPDCATCPLSPSCAARAAGTQERYPRKRARTPPQKVRACCGLATDEAGRLLMARRPAGVLLGGLWELPGGELTPETSPQRSLQAHLHERLGLDAEIGRRLGVVEHVFSHRHLTLDIYAVPAARGALTPAWYDECAFLDAADRARVPRSRLTDKVLEAVGHG